MADRELSPDEVAQLGLDEPEPQGRALSDDEVTALGLEDAEAPSAPKTTGAGAFFNHLGNGFSKGWGDELANAIDPGDDAYRKLPDGRVVPYSTKNYLRDQRKLESDEHPWPAFLGNVAGELITDAAAGYVTGGAISPVNPLGSAALGALSGAGNADENTPGGTGGGAGIGAAAGLVGYGVGKYAVPALLKGAAKVTPQFVKQGASAVADYIPEKVRKFATEQALKAAGYIQKDIKPIARHDPAKAAQMGQTLLDEGMVHFGDDAAAVAERLEPGVDAAGERIGELLQKADQLGGKFSMGDFVDRARSELLDPILNDPAKARKAQWLAQKLDEYAKLGDLPFTEANRLKSNLQSEINFGNRFSDTSPDPQEFWKDLAGTMRDEIDSQMGREAGTGIQGLFQQAKGKYGTLVDALDKSRQGLARDAGNSFVSSKDALIGAGIGGGPAAMALMNGDFMKAGALGAMGIASTFGSKLVRERGSSAAAVGANKLAGTLEKILQSNPQALGQFAKPLQAAAAKGPEALATANYVLSQQNPFYREIMQRVAKMTGEDQDEVAAR